MFFGWYIVVGTLVAQLLLIGFFTYAVSLLIGPVQAEFGVSLEDVMYSLTMGTLVGMVAMPVGGILIDRFSARWVMTAGAIFYAVGLYAISQAETIGAYVVWFGVTMAVGNALVGAQSSTTTISRWFTSSRGRALGISALGTSIGGVLIPWLMTRWIEVDGWRVAVENLAWIVAVVLVPLMILSIRGTPEEAGMHPEGGEQPASVQPMGALTIGEVLKNPGYWYIGLCLGLLFCAYSAVLSNITPYATGLGVDTAAAAQLIMVVAIAGFIGKLIFGFVADKVNLKFGLWAALALVFTGFVILSFQPSYSLMVLATVCLGLAAGGQLPVWGAMMAKVFGLVSYGKAMGLMGPLITLMVMPGFVVVGYMVDSTGSYEAVLQLFSGMIVLSAILLVPLRFPEESQAAG